jgi:hypothetical protein
MRYAVFGDSLVLSGEYRSVHVISRFCCLRPVLTTDNSAVTEGLNPDFSSNLSFTMPVAAVREVMRRSNYCSGLFSRTARAETDRRASLDVRGER